VEEVVQTCRLYTLHCGIDLKEDETAAAAADAAAAAATASQEMSYADKHNHHLWLKSKASR